MSEDMCDPEKIGTGEQGDQEKAPVMSTKGIQRHFQNKQTQITDHRMTAHSGLLSKGVQVTR